LNSKNPATDRPEMEGYGIQPVGNGADLIPWSEVSRKLAEARNYWVATTRKNGNPHAMPVWGVWLDETFYFGTGADTVKARNLKHNPAIVVHLESGDDVVILEGTATEVSDKALLKHIYVDVYGPKYDLDMSAQAEDDAGPTFALSPTLAFAWLESDFPNTATRYRFS
jgi:nitroimidazol reductase NimA-like FMN-containing flavoprotein (pyridoxamine 5'-phosphate oxidase superfamily)